MNSRLAGTTMCKISFEGALALKRAGLVLMFRTVYSARLQYVSEKVHSYGIERFSIFSLLAHYFTGGSFLKRLQRTTSKLGTQKGGKSLQAPEVVAVCNVCDMYQTAIATLTELRRDILTGKVPSNTFFSPVGVFILNSTEAMTSVVPVLGLGDP